MDTETILTTARAANVQVSAFSGEFQDRDRIKNRLGPDDSSLLREIMDCTRVVEKAAWRATLEPSEIVNPTDGNVFIKLDRDLRFITLTKYHEDAEWSRLLR